MTYAELQKALHLFGFHESDRLTIRRIKERHRTLLKESHPDLGNQADAEGIRNINEAAKCIMGYVQSYRFSFSPEEFYRQNPEEHLRRQFSWDPVWSSSLEEK